MSRFSPVTFAVAFAIAYAVFFWFNLPMFLYYPQVGLLHWGWTAVPSVGPGMAWFGLMADAALIGLVAAFVLPRSLVERPLHNFVWVIPIIAMVVYAIILRNWFLMT